MPNPVRSALLAAPFVLFFAAAPAASQVEPPPREAAPELPREVARAVVDFYNDPRRARHHGPTVVSTDSVVQGDIAVVDGPLEVQGRVEGSVLMINGDLLLAPGSAVAGDILVVGGSVEGLRRAYVRGEVLIHPGALGYRIEDGRMVLRDPPPPRAGDRAGTEAGAPRSGPEIDFLMTTGNSYNRVEGLPITFGPRLRTGGTNPLHLNALAIYRTESGFTSDIEEIGYYVRAQQYLGDRQEWSVGATLHSLTNPIEDWHLTDLENGLATFLLHQDYRDHYEREGFSAFATWEPGRGPLTLTGEVRWELNRSLAPGSPLTLFDNAEPWRAQPVVGEGRIGTLAALASYDTRSDLLDPSSGWYLRGRFEQGFDVELERPELFPAVAGDPGGGAPALGFGRFTAGFLDLRRYNRISPDVRLNLRAMLGGSLTGSTLPPQRQHAFGGEGSLPGYSVMSQDCGARAAVLARRPQPTEHDARAYPYYGCDAFALVQVEVRGKLDFRLRLDSAPWDDDDEGLGFGWDIAPDWAIFVDGGTGWAFNDREDERLRLDAGAGLLVDRFGIFVAAPLSGGDGLNVFVRLGPRF